MNVDVLGRSIQVIHGSRKLANIDHYCLSRFLQECRAKWKDPKHFPGGKIRLFLR